MKPQRQVFPPACPKCRQRPDHCICLRPTNPMHPNSLAPTADIPYDPTGPRNGKWYIRRADGVLNSYETLAQLAAFAADPQLLWDRYHQLMQQGREWTLAEANGLREWLVAAGIVTISDIF